MRKIVLPFFMLIILLSLMSCGDGEKAETPIYEYMTTQTDEPVLSESILLTELTEVFAAFESVLRSERAFSWSGERLFQVYLDEYRYNFTLNPHLSIAIVDINDDGIPEILVALTASYTLMLFYYDGEIFGEELGFRINYIKTDGTYRWHWRENWSVSRLNINHGNFESEDIFFFYIDEWSDPPTFSVNNIEVSEEYFREAEATAMEYLNAKEDLIWHPFIAGNLIYLWQCIEPTAVVQCR